MTTDEYQLVIDWGRYLVRAEALGLTVCPDKSRRSIIVEESGLDGGPVAHVKLEHLSAWLDGFESAQEIEDQKSDTQDGP